MIPRLVFAGFLMTLPGHAMLGCMAHQSSGQRLLDAARELNEAARFGRMDVAAGLTAKGARLSFLERRSTWGNDIRVMDVNVANIQVDDDEHAQVVVEVAWTHLSDSTLRNTQLTQRWENIQLAGWKLAREQRTGGDGGLFGEKALSPHPVSHRDVHFPTKSLGRVE